MAIAVVAYLIFPSALLQSHPDLRGAAFIAIMVAGLVGNIVMTGMLYVYARGIAIFRLRFDRAYILHLLRITLPYGLALFLNVMYFKADVVILSVLEPAATADTSIALYSVPMKIVEVGMMFGTLFLNSMLPLFTRAIRDRDTAGFMSLVTHAYRNLTVLALGIVGIFLAVGTEILRFISSAEYTDHSRYAANSVDALHIVISIFLFFFLSSLFTYILIANEEQGRLLRINALLTVVNIIGNILLIPYFSFIGSAWVTLVCQILLFIMTYASTRHIIAFRPPVGFTVALVAGCGAGIILTRLVLTPLSLSTLATLLLGATIFSAVYGTVVGVLYRDHIAAIYRRIFMRVR